MITQEIRAEIRRLVLRDGWKVETVARRFGVHHSVVRRMIRDDASLDGRRAPKGSLIDPHREFLVSRLGEHPELTSTRLLLELRDRGYAGGVSVVRRYVAKIRAPRQRKAYLRVETDPGEQAQVDWGSFGQIRIGATQRPLSAFAMVLSWSRMLFIDFSLDQQADTFLRMHQRAFAAFGGIPKKLLYDNLKTVVLHHVGSTVQFNPAFLAFAGHYLFEPVAAPVRYPQAKGRVEGAIRYIRHAFFYGRQFRDIDDLRAQAALWCQEVANQRLHATTRERPAERLLVERTRLRALPEHPFDAERIVVAIVSKEARVVLDTNAYSVPHQLVGQTVHVRANDSRVRVIHDGAVVAEHRRSWERRRAIEDPAHVQAMLEKRPGARPIKLRDRIAALSSDARLYLQEIARRRIDLDNEIRKLERLALTYGQADIAAAFTKALAARTFGARYVQAFADQIRFARGLGEPPEPVITGNPSADNLDVEPHALESYDALFQETPDPETKPGNDGPAGDEPEPESDG
jgi:transposase